MLPSTDYRRTWIPRPDKISEGLDAALEYVVGGYRRSQRFRAELERAAESIHASGMKAAKLTDRQLKIGLAESRDAVRRSGPGMARVVEEALPYVAEAASRTVGLKPYPVQIMAALALDRGYLAEMATGEGKSLTAAIAGVMAGWSGRPCHILTTNDYLAGRDAWEFNSLYRYCGLTAGAVVGELDPAKRKELYGHDVVYTTSKELLADFLRDRIYLGQLHHPQRRLLREILEPYRRIGDGVVLRGIDTAIIDEADSVMIDEAVTPLIISTQQENQWLVDATNAAGGLVNLFESDDYTIDQKYREIEFKETGLDRLAEMSTELPPIWRGASRREEIMRQALVARQFYHLDQHYVIQDGKIVIVDEFTGRLMHSRSWGNGLHQAVEAKEGLELTAPTETLARLSFQRFFRLFRRLSGMTGTAKEASAEFWHIYRLPVISIPTHRPLIRDHLPPAYFQRADDKWQSILQEIEQIHGQGRPVLVGTRSVNSSRMIADLLDHACIPYRLLNATHHADEATIIKQAGQGQKITIATNMAGRGTDIKLTQDVVKLGGLHVIVAERNESGRIDRQLVGRCARQGDPGSSRVFASLEDDLITRYGSRSVRKLADLAFDQQRIEPRMLLNHAFNRAADSAQKLAYQRRKTVLRTDTWLDDALIFAGSDGVH